nr:hypothetical protein EU244_28225 [Rhodococcus qingshengii]
MYKTRPMSPTRMRSQWLTGLIREVHTASRQTYGSRRVHAELTRGMDIVVSENLVAELMRIAGIVGLPGPAKVKRLKGVATADDLVHRKFHRLSPNELWVNDITNTRLFGFQQSSQHLLEGVAMAGKKYTDQQKEEFFRLLDRGGTVRDAARAVGVHENAGYNWLRKTGLTMARAAPRPYPAELKAEFLRLVREREIISTVAHDLGIHRPTAYAWARKAGISTSEARKVNPRREEFLRLRAAGLTRVEARARVGADARSATDWDKGIAIINRGRVYPDGRVVRYPARTMTVCQNEEPARSAEASTSTSSRRSSIPATSACSNANNCRTYGAQGCRSGRSRRRCDAHRRRSAENSNTTPSQCGDICPIRRIGCQ